MPCWHKVLWAVSLLGFQFCIRFMYVYYWSLQVFFFYVEVQITDIIWNCAFPMPNLEIGCWCWWGFLIEFSTESTKLLCLHSAALNADSSPWHAQAASKGPHVERQIWQNNISTRIPVKRLKIFWYLDVQSGCDHLESWLSINTGLQLIVSLRIGTEKIVYYLANEELEMPDLKWRWFPLIFQLVSLC